MEPKRFFDVENWEEDGDGEVALVISDRDQTEGIISFTILRDGWRREWTTADNDQLVEAVKLLNQIAERHPSFICAG